MKFSAITQIICITLICFSFSNNPMVSGDELEVFRQIVSSSFLTDLPVVGMASSAMALVLDLADAPVSTDDLMKELKDVHKTVDSIHVLMKLQPELVSRRTMELDAIETDERVLAYITNLIDRKFREMRNDANKTHLLQEDVKKLISEGAGTARTELERLVGLLNPRDAGRTNILEKIYNNTKQKIEDNEYCDNHVSLNEYIWRKYRSFMMTIGKGYAMIQEAYKIHARTEQEEFNERVISLQKDYDDFKKEFSNKIAKLMAQSSVSIRRCDPPKHERGKTFLEFERLIQGYLVHESRLRPPRDERKTCGEYRAPTYISSNAEFKDYTHCSGKIFDCVSADQMIMMVCPTDSRSRRFDGTQAFRTSLLEAFDGLRDQGNVTNCKNGRGIQAPTPDFFHRSELCRCYCDDYFDQQSFRYLESHPVFSDYKNNMVITGLRLLNETSYERSPWRYDLLIQIQQGKLGPYGHIDPTTVEWKKTQKQEWDSCLVLIMDKRSINLNTIHLPPDFAMIGVQFTQLISGHVQLRVYARRILYETGKILDDGNWMSPHSIHDPEPPKSELEISNSHIPSLAAKNVRIDGKDKFIKLQPTDWEKDAAQTVVPFIDIQEVVTNPPTLLGGVGFAYRSTPGYGGFLSLEIHSWNYTDRVLKMARNDP